MNTQLPSSLPKHKLKEIEAIKQVIAEFVDPDMIILYGSYARGEYKDQVYLKDGIRYFYISDYDLIIVTNKTNIKEYELANELENRISARPDINFFMYDIDYVNKELVTGNFFFVPVYFEGVILYNNGNSILKKPKPLSIEQIKKNISSYYDFWIGNTNEFYETALEKLEKTINGKTRSGLTLWFLFQTLESIYSALLLVFMGIKPKLHNLYKYRRSVNMISAELNAIFPEVKDSNERRLFDVLNRAYISGKYKMDFEVSLEDLKEISSRLARMIKITDRLCMERIESFQ
ncbi:nucleotidyltransferase domain-containing protein [Sphingobacterium thalpophilum]|uniref:Nucleotidyltransferase domain-containing protein n=1 Tax=Sphingobacterium thalpophilum TaxID=259 RepID=A0ACD5C6L3_9SPHI|nr:MULTISPECIES: nucleotidyltransferase domain-containing protein [Sphingobacterium]